MLSARFGPLLKGARKQRGLTRSDLAARAGVSVRLVAELEQGKRPNVSLESALKLLRAAGVSLVARSPDGSVAEIRSPAVEALERAQRAAVRRRTWTGSHTSLHSARAEPAPERSRSKRIAFVQTISLQAYSIATAGRGRAMRVAEHRGDE